MARWHRSGSGCEGHWATGGPSLIGSSSPRPERRYAPFVRNARPQATGATGSTRYRNSPTVSPDQEEQRVPAKSITIARRCPWPGLRRFS